jgi:RNA polymerase sigma-32 factor
MARAATVLILAAESGLTHYFAQIRRFPMLERQEEYVLAKRWREHGDRDAAHKLVTSHLRLVTKIARDYRGYGLPISEAISEGNVGLCPSMSAAPARATVSSMRMRWCLREVIRPIRPSELPSNVAGIPNA